MVTKEYEEYLKSETWQRLRSKRLAIDEYRCQRCGTPYGGLQVHHLVYPLVLGTENPYTDLITLCATCHQLVEHNKTEYRKDKKDAWLEQSKYEKRLIYRTIKEKACNDLSAIGIGTRDYCNIDVIKEDFGPEFEGKLKCYGYVSRVQEYFVNTRYRIILKMMEDGYTPRDIIRITGFSVNMVTKVCNRPDKARAILKNEKEQEYYEQAE